MGVKVKFHRGAWWVFVTHQNRRRAKKVGADKGAAQRIAKAIEERLARADLALSGSVDDDLTLRRYAEQWLGGADVGPAALKASTIRFYRDNLENHVYPVLGAVPLARLTRQDVRRLLLELRGKALRPRTITGILRTLSTVLSEAVEDDKLQANPALRPGRLRRHMRDPNVLRRSPIDPYTRDEVEQLLATARAKFPSWAPFLLVAVRTGLRLGELRALQWGDLDWHARFVQVERNFVEGVHTVPKTGRGRRVDLSTQTVLELRLWRRRQTTTWFARGLGRPALVFPSEARTPLDDSQVRKAMAAIAAAAEVRVRRSPVHVLRHTFASLLLQQGEPIVYVKEQLGHASIQLTVDVYGHLLPGGNRSAVDRLDEPNWKATIRNLSATGTGEVIVMKDAKLLTGSGEPPRNRTENPQIKSRSQPPGSLRNPKDSTRRGGKS